MVYWEKVMNKEWVLSIQGGGQRAVFACGVVDVLIEEGIFASEAYGCSAGNWIGLNYVQKKKGAASKLFFDTKFKDILTPLKFFKGGSLIDFDHYFSEKKNKDLDKKAILDSDMGYYAVCTNLLTCKPLYVSKEDPFFYDACEGSCSLTAFTKGPKMVGDIPTLDGGYVERIPFLKALSEGKKIVIVSNREKGFRFEDLHEKNELVVQKRFKDYPNFVEGYQYSHIVYHEHLRQIEEMESKGEVFVIYPPHSLNIEPISQNDEELKKGYELGVETARKILPELKKYLLSD